MPRKSASQVTCIGRIASGGAVDHIFYRQGSDIPVGITGAITTGLPGRMIRVRVIDRWGAMGRWIDF